LPHVHDRQADFLAFFKAEPDEELIQTLCGAVLAAEPDGAAAFQIADHNAVLVSLGDGDLVDANDPRSGVAHPSELLAHVLLVQFLDGVPIEVQFLGHFLNGGRAATSAHEEGEPLGIQRVVGEPVEPFALHASTPRTLDPTEMENEVDALVATGEIPSASSSFVVVGVVYLTADAAHRFFWRRWRVMSTARGSPKTPWTLGWGANPGNR
jgi:hypothetical protein